MRRHRTRRHPSGDHHGPGTFPAGNTAIGTEDQDFFDELYQDHEQRPCIEATDVRLPPEE